MYIGEVVRNVLLHLIDNDLLFQGRSSSILNTHYGLDTALMSAIEAHPSSAYSSTQSSTLSDEWSKGIEETKKVLTEQLGIDSAFISPQDCLVVRRVCEIVGTRGARLAAVAVAAVLLQTGHDKKHPEAKGGYEDLHVGVDGSLVEFYPGYETRLRQALKDMVGDELEGHVKIGLAKDGSGVGAALAGLQAKKQQSALSEKEPEKLGKQRE